MTDKIKAGTILIKDGALLPKSLWLESEPCSNGWRQVKPLDGSELDGRVHDAGWTFFSLTGEIEASAYGVDPDEATHRAVTRLLANLNSDKLNCLEITQVACKRFVGLPYVSVSAHSRHIQKSMFLCRDNFLAERDGTKLSAA